MAGGGIKRIRDLTHKNSSLLTYGDGIADINLSELIQFLKRSGGWATVTAVNPPARFVALEFDSDGKVSSFNEKIENNLTWINGGFLFLSNKCLTRSKMTLRFGRRDPFSILLRQEN